MSNIQPKKQDLDGVEYLSANESTNIKISGDDSSSNGARIELGKDLTTTPIISHLSGDGFDFGVLGNFTFPQMVLAKEKLQAVVTPLPSTDTLKINKKVLLDDGAGNTGTLDINGTDLEISSSGNIHLNPTGAIGIGGANYGTSGQVLTSNGASAPTWSSPTGYSFVNRLYFNSVGSFTFLKSNYPYLRAIKVVCVGGGGGGGQTDYFGSAGEAAAATGGSGGAYAERFITNIAGLSASVPIVVGDGGAGGVGGTLGVPNGTLGLDGDPCEFGTLGDAYYTKGSGGKKGDRGAETFDIYGASGITGNSGIGDFTINGFPSENAMSFGSFFGSTYILANGSNGGNSVLGAGGRSTIVRIGGAGSVINNGDAGLAFGGGGAGGAGATRTAGVNGANGGKGGRGIVWVELYA